MNTGLLRADRLNLGRFGIDGMTGDINLTARAGTWDALSFSGSIRSHSRDMINDPVSAEAMIVVDRDDIRISSLSYSTGSLTLTSESIGFSSGTGIASGSVSVSTSLPRADGPLPTSTPTSGPSVALAVEVEGLENLFCRHRPPGCGHLLQNGCAALCVFHSESPPFRNPSPSL